VLIYKEPKNTGIYREGIFFEVLQGIEFLYCAVCYNTDYFKPLPGIGKF